MSQKWLVQSTLRPLKVSSKGRLVWNDSLESQHTILVLEYCNCYSDSPHVVLLPVSPAPIPRYKLVSRAKGPPLEILPIIIQAMRKDQKPVVAPVQGYQGDY